MASYSTSSLFDEAASFLSSSRSLSGVSNTLKLELYGLFKILTVAAEPNMSKPSIFDMAGRAKWDAWAKAGKEYMGRLSDAENRYIKIARELGWKEGTTIEEALSDEDSDLEGTGGSSRSSGSSRGGGGTGLGVSVSTLAAPDTVEDDDGSELHRLAVEDDAFALSNLLNDTPGLDVNQRDQYGYTALHLAADRGSLTAVKTLLTKGADVTLQDPDEMTALDLAKCAGHEDIVTELEAPRS